MNSTLILLLCSVGAFILYRFVSSVTTRFRHAKAAKQRGCKPAPQERHADPLALITVVKAVRSHKRGQLLDFIGDRFHKVAQREGRTVLTIQSQIFGDRMFVTSDPKNIQALLATQFKDFALGPVRNGVFSPLLGGGIFSTDGKQWEHARALLRPQFARDQVSDLELEERHLQNMLKALPVQADGWTATTDLQPLNFRLTIDSATEFLFGESVNTQLSALPGYGTAKSIGDAHFVKCFELCTNVMARAFIFNDYYSFAFTKEFREACKTCHEYIDRFVQKALSHEKGHVADSSEKEKYVFLESLAAEVKDPIEIRDQLLSILVAGRDTTASLLSFLFLMLAAHPEVFNKLRATIINEFGTFKSPRNISFASLKACTYLQWCLNETLRLFPTVPSNSRRSVVDTTLPRGGGEDGLSPVFIPKGTEVNYLVYIMHRHPDLWGADADKFVPERWEGKKVGFDYLPFNGGPRICLGQQFALTEAGYVTVRLLQRFDKMDGSAMAGLPIDWILTLTGRPMYGAKLRMHAAPEE